MFATGLFKSITCPAKASGKPCKLGSCCPYGRERSGTNANAVVGQGPIQIGTSNTSARDENEKTSPALAKPTVVLDAVENGTQVKSHPSVRGDSSPKQADSTTASEKPVADATDSAKPQDLPKDRAESDTLQQKQRKLALAREETLILAPKELKQSPATIPQRLSYLKTIHKTLCAKNHRLPKHAAISLEYKTASGSNTTTYPVAIRSLIKDIRNGMYTDKRQRNAPANDTTTKRRHLHPKLAKVVLSRRNLATAGYVTTKPAARKLDPSEVFPCDRCGMQCPVGSATATRCRFHTHRRNYDISTRTRSDYFPCCGGRYGFDPGCKDEPRHVFKFGDSSIMEGFIPFKHLSVRSNSQLFAVGIDCEMGYTTFGVELIRVTVVDWDTLNVVVDEIVQPYGKVIDLNTVFSGVLSVDQGISFQEARNRVSKFVGPDTIIIGHSLYHDLNALRLLHDQVIDTACLYPTMMRPKPYSLKNLAFRYLGRTIQTGEHDSAEDAIAAMDVVYANIA